MVPWGVTNAGESVVRSATAGDVADDAAVRPQTTGNRLTDDPDGWPDGIDAVWRQRTGKLSLPATTAVVRRVDDGTASLPSDDDDVPPGRHLLVCGLDDEANGRRETYLSFEGPARIRRRDRHVTVTFDRPRETALGRSRPDPEACERMTVPFTPEGIATALSYSTAAHQTTSPSRSHPAFRDHPPLLELGESVAIPSSIRTRRPETGIEVRVPNRLDALFVVAPLAYYLCADVSVVDNPTPTLSAPTADLEYRFPSLPTFQESVATLLRKTFFLDCLVRPGATGTPASRDDLLSALGLRPAALRECSPAERLSRYLDVPNSLVRANQPDWHLSTYASPDREHVSCLPHLLDSLSLVFLPEATELAESDLLDKTLDDSYRGANGVRSVHRVNPDLQEGRVHAWLAPGTPIDAYKTTPRAYENRHTYREREDNLSVTVVLNDDDMADERAAAADIYRRRSADLPIDLTVRETLTTDQLRSVFAAEHDFLHYIGHCEESGLCCPDGNLSLATLERSRTRTFFLNACGSYHEGLRLVDRGSVAGAVTLTKVLDSHAAKVGTAFARLLVHGFGFERAMQLARRRILMGKDYTVVGDGTYSLLPVGDPGVISLDRDGDRFEFTYEVLPVASYGGSYASPLDDTQRLHGTATEESLSRTDLLALLTTTSLPVIYDDEFNWSDELAARIRTDG